jgi:hypothetical protein
LKRLSQVHARRLSASQCHTHTFVSSSA